MRNTMAQLALAASVLAALLVLPATTTAAGAGTTSSPSYYVSIGDSYAIGYQPDPTVSLRFGYTRGVISAERKRGTNLTLANFGCGGATTTSLLTTAGCPDPAPPAERRSLPHRPAGDGRHRLHRRAPWSRRVDHHLHRWQ